MSKFLHVLMVLLTFVGIGTAQNVVTVTDADIVAGGTYNWTSDNVYLLDGFVFAEEGATINIEAGTIIKGKEVPTSNDLASTLIITRGATINAVGTANQPIVFTAEIDNIETTDAPELDGTDRGLWGGLIILGNGLITSDGLAEVAVEGLPAEDPRSLYGGDDNADNSGTLKYVSIRHGGAELAPGEEINGLTLGAVGSGTTIEHVEVFANSDDGIEWFGGAANVKFASVGFCADDAMDYDIGWLGKGQFWFVIQGEDDADNGGEHDGAKPDSGTPSSNPTIYNATYIGSGVDSPAKNEHALLFRDGSRGIYANSVFTDYANYAIQVEDRASGVDSRQYMESFQLNLFNNVWFGFGEGSELNAGANGIIQATDDAEDPTAQFLITHLTTFQNTLEDPQLAGISRDTDGGLDPRPASSSPVFSNLQDTPNDDFFTSVDYKGAFGSDLWVRGWTALDRYNYLPEQTEVVITDADLVGGETYTWTSDNVYLLDGFVYLEEGGKLFIEPGTVIKGKEVPTSNDLASTLIIARGASICAEGTAEAPIIFTAEIDDETDPSDMAVDDRGLWGGLIILGNATITSDGLAEVAVEGLPAEDPRSLYGGTNDADNSGSLKYVSIRHGGAELAPGEEINGLTLGAVGSETSIEYVEVLANSDDGIEWFGGTVSVKYATVAFCGDDSYDYDTGWRGNGQFWLSLQSADEGDNGGEHDGAKPDSGTPSSNPSIFNATYIGSGVDGTAKNEHALLFRDGTRGTYKNSIFTDFANYAIQVEDRASGVDSRQYMENGELVIANNLWFGFGEGTELNAGANGIIQATDDAEDPSAQFLVDHLINSGNRLDDPMLGGISRVEDGGFDPRPTFDGPAYTTDVATYPDDPFFTRVAFKGAFCSDGVWINGWTALSQYGVLGADVPTESGICDELPKEVVVINDADLFSGGEFTWTSNNIYLLDGFVYLEEGGKLTIEPGTVIKGKEVPTTNDLASTLIIARGASICAEGTQEAPIVFTAEIDDTDDPDDMAVDDRGLWGGLIILGQATITSDGLAEVAVEGLPAEDPRALYGGTDDADNSGSLKFVSIRHGGAELAPGEEINGLTLGGVGSSTMIDYVEVVANSDDGIEWFGGTVSVSHASVAFCGDDSYDYDTGWRGGGQFWFSLQSPDEGDNAGEHDGAKPDSGTPSSNPLIYNATYIGSGVDGTAKNEHALYMRDGSRGTYGNSIFTDFANYAIQIEDRASGVDSRSYMEAGELVIQNNIWFGFGEGSELNAGENGIIQATADAEDPTAQFLIDHLAANGNTLEDPALGGISRTANGGLDPRPSNEAVFNDLATEPEGDFYKTTLFKGAFCTQGAWIAGWTALAEYGVLSADVPFADNACQTVGVEDLTTESNGFFLEQNAPNPIVGMTNIAFELPATTNISLVVYDMNGKIVKQLLNNTRLVAGKHNVEFDATALPNGTYVYSLFNANVTLGRVMIVKK